MRIVLVGFMGSGKTTVAKLLAKKIKLKLIDMDELTLKQSGRKNINEIFSLDGEQKFRRIEYAVAKKISGGDNVVIATGGGVVINPLIMDFLKTNSLTVYLQADFDKMKQRVYLKKIKPPLFQDTESAKKIFDLRASLYEQYSDIIIETDDKNVNEVADEIIERLRSK